MERLNHVDFETAQLHQFQKTPSVQKQLINNFILIKRPDGRIAIMSKEQYIRYIIEIQKRLKPPKSEFIKPYELGEERNGIRTIGVENVTDPINNGTSAPKQNSCSPDKIQEYKDNITNANGQIDNFKQGMRGDCYLLAAIDSIANTEDGQNILQKNIKKNSNGSYTITLPGAVAAKNHYIKTGYEDKCSITGQYTITPEAIEKAKQMSGKSYAYGDFEIIALELAMEAFRAEVAETNKALGQKSSQYIAGQIGPMSEYDTLSNGQMYDAVFILTGQKSDIYQAKKQKRKHAKLYTPGEYGYVGDKKLQKGIRLSKRASGIVEVNNVYNKDSDLQKMLDKYKGKEDNFSITVGVFVAIDGPDGSTKAGGGHALTVTKITDEYVEVVNPWDSTKAERIPRGDFEAMAMALNVAPVSKEHSDKFYAENGLTPNQNNVDSNSFIEFIKNLLKSDTLAA